MHNQASQNQLERENLKSNLRIKKTHHVYKSKYDIRILIKNNPNEKTVEDHFKVLK